MLTIGCPACGQPFTFLAQGEELGGVCPYCGANSNIKAQPLVASALPEPVADELPAKLEVPSAVKPEIPSQAEQS